MNREKAQIIFYDYVKKDYQDVEILSVEEREYGFLFNFIERGDEFPVDYPVILIDKATREARELSYLEPEDAKIIWDGNNGKK